MRLSLIRHPKPMVAPGICYGSTDVDADKEDVARLLPLLEQRCVGHALVFSSPLRRCMQLAEPLGERLGLSVNIDARLVEIDFGQWEMQPWDQIARSEIDAWAADVVNYPVGGAQSALVMAKRVCEFYTRLQVSQQDCIVISHAGTMRLLQACHQGLAPEQMVRLASSGDWPIGYGELLMLVT